LSYLLFSSNGYIGQTGSLTKLSTPAQLVTPTTSSQYYFYINEAQKYTKLANDANWKAKVATEDLQNYLAHTGGQTSEGIKSTMDFYQALIAQYMAEYSQYTQMAADFERKAQQELGK
jgi:hypothetical protein